MTLPSGINVGELDPGIRPQDDLFRHVNGRWLARTEIPADRSRDSTFRVLADQAEHAVREIVEDAASAPEGSEERKLGDLYASFMDADRAERLGSQPISQMLAAARAVSSVPELLETLGRLEPWGIGGLYRLFVSTDPGHPERYLVFFEQGAISLPDESYYREERFAGVRDAFAGHVRRMFELAGLPDADRAAGRVFALETAVAGHHWDRVASRDREKTYNLFTWTGLLSEGPPPAPQARESVPEEGQLDLGAALGGPGVLGEDVEDHRGAVDRRPPEQLLQVAMLRGRQLVVEDDGVRVEAAAQLGDLLGFAAPDEGGRVGGITTLHDAADDIGTGAVDQLGQFVQLLRDHLRGEPGEHHTHQDDALPKRSLDERPG